MSPFDRERYRALFEAVSQGVVVHDAEGVIVEVNRAAEEILGISAEDASGRLSTDRIWECVCEDGSPFPGEEHPASVALRTNKPVRDVVMGVRQPSTGEIRWLLVNAEPMHDADSGQIAGAVVTFADITQLKTSQMRLRRSWEHYRGILDRAPIGVWLHDLSGVREVLEVAWEEGVSDYLAFFRERPDLVERAVQSMEVVDVNESVAERFGADDISDLKRALPDLVSRTMSDIIPELLARLAAGETVIDFSGQIETLSGDLREVDVRLQVMPGHEEDLSAVVVWAVDVTERKRLEERLRQSQKMQALGKLASGVAHDFNNMLTAIAGNLELAGMCSDPKDETREYIAEAMAATRRAAQLTRQLLTFSRPQGGTRTLVRINKLVSELEPMLRRTLPESIALEVELNGDGAILVDPSQMDQVIMNLVVNARDAMPAGGRVSLTTREVVAPSEAVPPTVEPGRYVVLTVEDTGMGIDQAHLPHIFEPFFTTKSADRGTGLGLATVYNIVDSYGGRIDVTSEPGEGTCFCTYLPAADCDCGKEQDSGCEVGGEGGASGA